MKETWKNYPEDKYEALLELMMKFELCFNFEGKKEYIVPELLRPQKCSFEWTYQNNLHFQYKYDFMPAGILTRFMVRKHHLIKDELHWKNGVIIEWDGTRAFIDVNEFDGKIDIWINGEDKKGMLGIIRCDIEQIHQTLNNPMVNERIPCMCTECINNLSPHFYNYHEMQTLLSKNVADTRCMKSAESMPINKLLGIYGMEMISVKDLLSSFSDRNIVHGDIIVKMGNDYSSQGNKLRNILDSNINLGNKDIKLNYDISYGISSEDFTELIKDINRLNFKQFSLLKKLSNELLSTTAPKQKESVIGRIKEYLISFGINIAGSLSASGILAIAQQFASAF